MTNQIAAQLIYMHFLHRLSRFTVPFTIYGAFHDLRCLSQFTVPLTIYGAPTIYGTPTIYGAPTIYGTPTINGALRNYDVHVTPGLQQL